jgi:formylglycine-generating enzyme required for sulfatase activity
MKGIENPTDEDAASTTHRADEKSSGNQQIYLPSFQPQGTTIMRGGTWKEGANDRCNSGGRLLSGGRGRYEDWGLRAAMTLDDGEEEETGGWVVAPASCPEPEITLAVGGDSSITMEFVYIPPGKFVMGGESTKDGKFTCLEVPHHPVELTRGFYLGKYPVTQEQYAAVMKGKNPSKSTKDPKCPVDCVGVDDAVGFCESSSEATGSRIHERNQRRSPVVLWERYFQARRLRLAQGQFGQKIPPRGTEKAQPLWIVRRLWQRVRARLGHLPPGILRAGRQGRRDGGSHRAFPGHQVPAEVRGEECSGDRKIFPNRQGVHYQPQAKPEGVDNRAG